MGYLPEDSPGGGVMVGDTKDGLLQLVVRSKTRVLHPVFPPTNFCCHDLRLRPRDFLLLPKDDKKFHLKDFI